MHSVLLPAFRLFIVLNGSHKAADEVNSDQTEVSAKEHILISIVAPLANFRLVRVSSAPFCSEDAMASPFAASRPCLVFLLQDTPD